MSWEGLGVLVKSQLEQPVRMPLVGLVPNSRCYPLLYRYAFQLSQAVGIWWTPTFARQFPNTCIKTSAADVESMMILLDDAETVSTTQRQNQAKDF